MDPSGGFENVVEQLKELAMNMTEQRTEYEQIKLYCDGVGKMFTPIKEQTEELKVTVKEMKDDSGFASASSGSPERDTNKGLSRDFQKLSHEAMNDMQEKCRHGRKYARRIQNIY